MLKPLLKLWSDNKGVAAIEFAIIFPLFLVLLFGTIELVNYNMQSRRAAMAANFAAEYISRDGDGVMQVSERHIVEDIWMIMNPTAQAATQVKPGNWANGYSRALSSVRFEKKPGCSSDCPYEPKVVWSFLYQDNVKSPVYMQCDVAVVSNETKLNGGVIRQGATGRVPIVIADFTYPYRPLLEGWLLPSVELHVSASRRTRSGTVLEHASDDFVTRCPA
ncbi:TadE-like protein [Rhizobium sp. RU33A]|uniref:TadE/TadG family type IV pilus assembly protein n=1 Tax=Rhizobium sp. RU33A TaxID=1907413 RepID=UPI0009570A1A|nr:TadE/TadG family type IV pilus assembly protein [Rhizobium sp. RU33A]SIQ87555.1 TadE-like protein [Rhizobium sp. RU33A]